VKLPQRWISSVREAVSPADSDSLDRAAFLMLLAFILSVPWLANAVLTESLIGAPVPIGALLVPVLCLAISAVSFSSRSPFRSIRPVALPIWSAVAVALFGALQLLPLPDRALQQIAPVNSQIYHEAGEILRLYGRSAPVPRVSIDPAGTAASALRIAGYMALLVVTAHLLRTRPRRRAFIAVLLAGSCIQVVLAAVLSARGRPFRGAFASVGDLADYLVILVPVAFGAVWAEALTSADRAREAADPTDRLERRLVRLALRGLALATLCVGIALTSAIWRVAATAVGILLLLAFAPRHPHVRRRLPIATGIGLVLCGLLAARASGAPFASLLSERTLDRTIAIWRSVLGAWREFPIFGAGLGAFPDAFRRVQPRNLPGLVDQARSDPLQLLVTGGAVGELLAVVAFASLLVLLVRRWKAQRHREESSLVLAGTGALVSFALAGLFEFNLGTPAIAAVLACVIGMALAAGNSRAGERRPRLP
jgi:O-antigen ligase